MQQARALGRDVVANIESRGPIEAVNQRARVQVADGTQPHTIRASGGGAPRAVRRSTGHRTTTSNRPLRSTGSWFAARMLRRISSSGARRRPSVMSSSADTPSTSRSEEHTSELQSLAYLVCRLLLEKKKKE